MMPFYAKNWKQRYWPIVLLISILFMLEACEADKDPSTLCGEALDFLLISSCKNGFNTKNLNGVLRRLRSRRQADDFLQPHIFKEEFNRPGIFESMRHKRMPSLKQIQRMVARWRAKHRITGKRLRRESPVKTGVADECCDKGCAYSDISGYCRNLGLL